MGSEQLLSWIHPRPFLWANKPETWHSKQSSDRGALVPWRVHGRVRAWRRAALERRRAGARGVALEAQRDMGADPGPRIPVLIEV